jgi:hypothetical protein
MMNAMAISLPDGRASQFLSAGLLCFCALLVPCIIIEPQVFHEDLGLSNYGINPHTEMFYALAFLASIFCNLRAAGIVQNHGFTWSLRGISLLQVALLVVPDSHVDAIRHAHVAIGMALFGAELLLTLWLAAQARQRAVDITILFLQILACTSSYLSLIHVLGWEAPSQLVFQVCFMMICIRAARRYGMEVRT